MYVLHSIIHTITTVVIKSALQKIIENKVINFSKFRYCGKVTKFDKISHLFKKWLRNIISKWKIFTHILAFSEYLIFKAKFFLGANFWTWVLCKSCFLSSPIILQIKEQLCLLTMELSRKIINVPLHFQKLFSENLV